MNTRTREHILLLALLSATLLALPARAQQVRTAPVRPDLLAHTWDARWIAHPTDPRDRFGVYHFRRAFTLETKPQKFVIHVSGDNRYRLFVNGTAVVNGPARGNLPNWRFESIDIAPFLLAGENVLGATVWNFAHARPMAQLTAGTGFILQGDTDAEAVVNTGDSWKVVRDEGYGMIPLSEFHLNAYVVVGPGETLDASKYPWGWAHPGYDDTAWLQARAVAPGNPKGTESNGVRLGWTLVPRDIPLMEETPERIPLIRRAEGIEPDDAFLKGTGALTIPAHTKATILLDQTHLTTAYPILVTSGGRGATLRLTYAESLRDSTGNKGNRDEIKGKHITGYQDVFTFDGGDHRSFRTLWFRTWRYIQLDIQTAGQPLAIEDFHGLYTGYPFEHTATFAGSDTTLSRIWNVGWRTARLCAMETYFDCPYYEQLQYVGDTRIQALISLYNTGDDRLVRQAITSFDHSRISDGLTESRYPDFEPQIIPPYSLFWVAMIHDYWMLRDDPAFVGQFLTGIRGVLGWYEDHVDSTGMLGPMPWWNFADWSFRHGGTPPGADDGHSALITLQFVYALDYAAELADAFHRPGDAAHYRELSASLKDAVKRLTWDPQRGLFADTPEKDVYTQHTNVMAVLVDLVPDDQQPVLMRRVLQDPGLIPVTYYYRFYVDRALQKAGLGDRFIGLLDPWRKMLAIGLTTFAEEPEPTRSDCHAWSAAPNYDFLALTLGVTPASPGFHTVRIAPNLGPLSWAKGTIPHPQGEITVDLKRNGLEGVQGKVILPAGVTGTLVWGGREVVLRGGTQQINLQ